MCKFLNKNIFQTINFLNIKTFVCKESSGLKTFVDIFVFFSLNPSFDSFEGENDSLNWKTSFFFEVNNFRKSLKDLVRHTF